MFKIFDMFGGFDVIKKMSREMGVDYKIYSTCLTSAGCNYAHIKMQYKIFVSNGAPENLVIAALTEESTGPFLRGIELLEKRYGSQKQLVEAREILDAYIEARRDEVDPAELIKKYISDQRPDS